MAGLIDRPARDPAARMVRASETGSRVASAWKVTLAAPASAYPGAHRSGLSIMRWQSRGTDRRLAQALHDRQADRQIGHEVRVHDIHVQPVGVAHGLGLFAQPGKVRGQDARRDHRLPPAEPAHRLIRSTR